MADDLVAEKKIALLERRYQSLDKRTALLKQMRIDDRESNQILIAQINKAIREMNIILVQLKENKGSKFWMYFVRASTVIKYIIVLLIIILMFIISPDKTMEIIADVIGKILK